MIARLKANMASASDAHTSWTVAKEGGNGYIFTATIINFDALGGLIMNEDQFQWDKENGVEYAANTMKPMGNWINSKGPSKVLYVIWGCFSLDLNDINY